MKIFKILITSILLSITFIFISGSIQSVSAACCIAVYGTCTGYSTCTDPCYRRVNGICQSRTYQCNPYQYACQKSCTPVACQPPVPPTQACTNSCNPGYTKTSSCQCQAN